MHGDPHDDGFTLIELLLVVIILGILASVVLAVSGVTSEAGTTACQADRRLLEKAGEAFFAQHRTDTIPPTGADEPYEQTLVDSEFLRATSSYYDLDSAGQLVAVAGSACTV